MVSIKRQKIALPCKRQQSSNPITTHSLLEPAPGGDQNIEPKRRNLHASNREIQARRFCQQCDANQGCHHGICELGKICGILLRMGKPGEVNRCLYIISNYNLLLPTLHVSRGSSLDLHQELHCDVVY